MFFSMKKYLFIKVAKGNSCWNISNLVCVCYDVLKGVSPSVEAIILIQFDENVISVTQHCAKK